MARRATGIADSSTTDETRRLESRFSACLGTARLACFKVLASGWETTVFKFRLDSAGEGHTLPAGVPLVLRLYHGSQGAAKGAREYRVMAELTRLKFPVPHPYWFETGPTLIGIPFLVMDWLAGGPLLQLSGFIHATRCFLAAFLPFVRTHVHLHRLAAESIDLAGTPTLLDPFPGDGSRSLLQRMLTTIAQRIDDGPLPWLRTAHDWACEQANAFEPANTSLLHLDYHPLNLLVRGTSLLGVIDWVSADFGDRHLDVATTAAIMSSTAMERPRWMGRNRRGNLLRRWYTALYIALYHSQFRLDFKRLRYYQAVAALFRLSTLGMMRRVGPESVGYRTAALDQVTPDVLNLLAHYLEKKSAIPIRIDLR